MIERILSLSRLRHLSISVPLFAALLSLLYADDIATYQRTRESLGPWQDGPLPDVRVFLDPSCQGPRLSRPLKCWLYIIDHGTLLDDALNRGGRHLQYRFGLDGDVDGGVSQLRES